MCTVGLPGQVGGVRVYSLPTGSLSESSVLWSQGSWAWEVPNLISVCPNLISVNHNLISVHFRASRPRGGACVLSPDRISAGKFCPMVPGILGLGGA